MSWMDHRFFYTDHQEVILPAGHRFPMEKYRSLRLKLIEEKLLESSQLLPSPPCSFEELALAHTEDYLRGVSELNLDPKLARLIGLPLTRELFLRSLCSVGGFLSAVQEARRSGFSAQLAGGTHHAFADHGEGFCVFNDFAVATLKHLQEKPQERILILDLDVHQGNGNSSILNSVENVFIVSLHGERNYPFRKVPSHWDVPLPAGVTGEKYLETLKEVLDELSHRPFDLIFYQAGVDVLKHDRLGSFDLDFDDIQMRDEIVFDFAKRLSAPLAMAIGGGYAEPIDLTVRAHLNTFRAAQNFF